MAILNTAFVSAPETSDSSLAPSEVQRLKEVGLDFRDGGSGHGSRIEDDLDALVRASLTVEDAAARLGVAAEAIEARLTSEPPTLYGFQNDLEWQIPEFQFEGDKLLLGLEVVVSRLDRDLHPVAFSQWFLRANPDLVDRDGEPLSPRQWLRGGLRAACVASLAAHLDAF